MTQAEQMINFAKSKIGSREYYNKATGDNYCQRFVRECGQAAGIYGSAASAAEARLKWKVSSGRNNVPLAAAVYFRGTNTKYGHVGIYIGGGIYIHANGSAGVMKAELKDAGGYLGWGWQGGVKPTGAEEEADAEASASSTQKTQSKVISSVVVKSVSGESGGSREFTLRNVKSEGTGAEILIQNDKIYAPTVAGSISVSRERNCPSKMTFEVVKDEILNFQEGNPVSFKFNGKKIFYGYVFTKNRTNNDNTISVTCYDQLRYLKNKDTLAYTNKKYSDVLKMIADDYLLRCGDVEDTGYVIGSRIEDGTLLDILGNASDLTVINSGRLYSLYDDFGEICLKNISNMYCYSLIYDTSAESFDYKTTIDENVYNKIKLSRDNDETGEREVYIEQDAATQREWGVLQYYESLSVESSAGIAEKARHLLNYYNQKRRSLKISGCTGSAEVRGGTLVPVKLTLGDIAISNFMMVEQVMHKFEAGAHLMDLKVSGIRGEFGE